MQNKEHQEVCKIRHLLNNVCIVKRPDKQMTRGALRIAPCEWIQVVKGNENACRAGCGHPAANCLRRGR